MKFQLEQDMLHIHITSMRKKCYITCYIFQAASKQSFLSIIHTMVCEQVRYMLKCTKTKGKGQKKKGSVASCFEL